MGVARIIDEIYIWNLSLLTKSGFQSLIEELRAATYSLRKLHVPELEFSETSRDKADGLKSLKGYIYNKQSFAKHLEEYIGYNQSFVKHLHFDPEAENLSK